MGDRAVWRLRCCRFCGGVRLAQGANIAAARCMPKTGAVVRTLRLSGSHTQTARAHVGDTIKGIVHMAGAHQLAMAGYSCEPATAEGALLQQART